MDNFQLYRTNILLGGQHKWDLILDSKSNTLIVKDFHLSPISSNSPQNKYPEETLLNYPHQENLRRFYKNTEGTFFNPCIDPRLSHNWIVLNNDNPSVVYEDSFEAGGKNTTYSLYNKPIEIFCPIWIEQVKESISFIIEVYSESDKKLISRSINPMHGKFGEYLKNYIKYLGLDKGVDDVLNINLRTKKAFLTGISLDSGNIIQKDISDIIYNLLYRERTLLEFDSMLINNFVNNRIIARQLFNFCFYIDLNDLLSANIAEMLYGNKLKFIVKTIVDGVELEIKDFYSNYEYIPRESATMKTLSRIFEENNAESAPNVLDYLYDYKYIKHINKNKFVQSTVHWSLNDNKDYLFNIYNGFGPYDYNGNKYTLFSHQYGKSPDLTVGVYSQALNTSGWCNSVNLDNIELLSQFMLDEDLYKKLKDYSVDLKPEWVNNIKYDISDTDYFKWDELKSIILVVNEDLYESALNSINNNLFSEHVELSEGIHYIRFKSTDDFIGMMVRNDKLDYMTFIGINALFDKISSNGEHKAYGKIHNKNHPLYYIKNKLLSAKSVPLVAINKSLYVVNAPSPSDVTTEVEYYKNDNASIEDCYVLRYDGKIKPTFLSMEESMSKNFKYFKIEQTEKSYLASNFAKYSNSSYPPIFPSIGYNAVDRSYEDFTKWNTHIKMLKPKLKTTLYSKLNKDGEYIKIKDIILEYLQIIYPNFEPEDVYNYYEVEVFYDYKTEYNINEYMYKIKMVLK